MKSWLYFALAAFVVLFTLTIVLRSAAYLFLAIVTLIALNELWSLIKPKEKKNG